MTKTPTGIAALKNRKPKVTATPEELQHQAALADIAKVTDVTFAKEQVAHLKEQYDALSVKRDEANIEYRAQERLRLKAAAAQQYLEAHEHLNKQEELQTEIDRLDAMLKPLVLLRNAAQARYAELFLADPHASYNQTETVTVSMIRVIDPTNGNYESATYLESCDTVQVSLSGKYFESEAYHLGSWAEENGFIVRASKTEIEL